MSTGAQDYGAVLASVSSYEVSGANGLTFECWVKPRNRDRSMVPARAIHSSGASVRFEILESSGYATVLANWDPNYYAPGGAEISSTYEVPLTSWTHLAVTFSAVAIDTVTTSFYINGSLVDVSASVIPAPPSFDRVVVGGYTGTQKVDGNAALWDGWVAHVALTPSCLSAGRIYDHYRAGADGFAAETSTARFQRLCRLAGVPAGMYDVDGTGASTMAAQPTEGASLLELIRQCADAEKGVGYVRTSGVLALAPRASRYAADVGLTIDARTQLGAAFSMYTDDALLVNDLTASRPGGATIRVVNHDSVESYGAQSESTTLYVDSDAQLRSAAEWQVYTSEPQPRGTDVVIDAVKFEASGGDVADLLAADIGTRISITNLPSDVSATSTVDLFIEGVSVRLEKHGPVFTFTTSPVGASGSVWIIEDPVYGAIEGDGAIAM